MADRFGGPHRTPSRPMAAPGSKAAPPSVEKQPSNPINIAGRSARKDGGAAGKGAAAAGGGGGGGAVAEKLLPLSQSCPPLRFVPPKAPSQRPRVPSMEPPPIELPPSPPLAQFGPTKERSGGAGEAAMDRALSRSLHDYRWSFSVPNSFEPHGGFAPSIVQGILEESAPASPAGNAAASASSFSEGSTIFHMMRESTSLVPPPASSLVGDVCVVCSGADEPLPV